MSAKDKYSTNAEMVKKQAKTTKEAAKAWEDGLNELRRYGSSWETLNINDYVPEHYDPSLSFIKGRKLFLPSKDSDILVVADFAGGYLRFMNTKIGKYVDKDGRLITGSQRHINDKTHYRILKKEEM